MTVRMLARLLLRIAWSTALVLAILAVIREAPAYALLSKQAAAGAVPTPHVAEEFVWSIAFAATACWLMVLDFLLLGWLVPWPRRGCPGCGYDLASLESDRCPECGLALPAQRPG
jgi:hypothetical protein